MKKQVKVQVKKQAMVRSKVRSQNPWQMHLKDVYASMKKKDSSVKLKDAMKSAKKTYICKKK